LDEWLKETVRDTGAIAGTFTVWDVLQALLLSFFLSLILVWVYRQTHRGLSYSVSFVHTIVIMAVTIAVVMLIIGSNLARAFALVGALSIIRFRTAIKDPRDVAFIFVAMATGMACGVRLPLVAVLFVLAICPMIYFLHRFDVGAIASSEVLVKLHVGADVDYHAALREVFYRETREQSLLSVEPLEDAGALELVFSVQLKPRLTPEDLVRALQAVDGVRRVTLLTGAQNVRI